MWWIYPIIGLLGAMASAKTRVAILNDIHLNHTYDFPCGTICYDLGSHGYDSPPALIDTILDDLHKQAQGEKLDAILISGDFAVHGISTGIGQPNRWPEMKQVIGKVMEMIQNTLPGVAIVSSIGNNDLLNHYQAPNATEKAMYYGELFELWFDNVTANTQQKGADPLKINETFRNGGYYRWDLSETLSVLSINSILSNFRDV
jgi:hypothetical protein